MVLLLLRHNQSHPLKAPFILLGLQWFLVFSFKVLSKKSSTKLWRRKKWYTVVLYMIFYILAKWHKRIPILTSCTCVFLSKTPQHSDPHGNLIFSLIFLMWTLVTLMNSLCRFVTTEKLFRSLPQLFPLSSRTRIR